MAKHPRTALIAQLVQDEIYDVDPGAVAGAIVARMVARRLVPDSSFRNQQRPPEPREVDVRSFRPSRRARSFHVYERRPGSVHA
jgi:hypothetical protein